MVNHVNDVIEQVRNEIKLHALACMRHPYIVQFKQVHQVACYRKNCVILRVALCHSHFESYINIHIKTWVSP